jgi:hypothetical protein
MESLPLDVQRLIFIRAGLSPFGALAQVSKSFNRVTSSLHEKPLGPLLSRLRRALLGLADVKYADVSNWAWLSVRPAQLKRCASEKERQPDCYGPCEPTECVLPRVDCCDNDDDVSALFYELMTLFTAWFPQPKRRPLGMFGRPQVHRVPPPGVKKLMGPVVMTTKAGFFC